MPTTANLNERRAATSGICLKREGATAFSTHLNEENNAHWARVMTWLFYSIIDFSYFENIEKQWGKVATSSACLNGGGRLFH